MTVKILGHWELAWKAPLQEFDTWIHPLKEFGIENFYMCPVTGIDKSRVIEKASIEEVLAENPTLTRVYVDERATVNLADFQHPDNALYIMGKTTYSPYLTNFNPETDLAVKIPSVNNSGGFWGDQAVIMVLYDRFLKGK